MEKNKILYDIVAKNAKSGKEAYEMVYDHIVAYISEMPIEIDINDELIGEELDLKLFNGDFNDYGNLTEDEAHKYVSNIIENEIILANYRKREQEAEEKLMY